MTDPRIEPLPFAVFDEFGNGADDRVQDHIRAQVERLQSDLDANAEAFDTERTARLEAQAQAKTLTAMVERLQEAGQVAIDYTPGKWFRANTADELEAFFLSRLPAIREAAKAHGYAVGLHGSLRRDLDLIAVPWRDGASDGNTLAHAIAFAACGLTRDGQHEWEAKPAGRVATSVPCCWTSDGVAGSGHIDLSIMATPAPSPAPVAQEAADTGAGEREAFIADLLVIGKREDWSFGSGGLDDWNEETHGWDDMYTNWMWWAWKQARAALAARAGQVAASAVVRMTTKQRADALDAAIFGCPTVAVAAAFSKGITAAEKFHGITGLTVGGIQASGGAE